MERTEIGSDCHDVHSLCTTDSFDNFNFMGGVRDVDAKKFSRWRRMTGVFCQISLIIPDKFTSPVSITVVSV